MDAADSWRAFACTGSIKDYLEYKRQQDTGPAAVIGEKRMDAFVTPGLVLKETRYKESDRILTLLTPGYGVISASAQKQPAAEEQIVQRLRAFLLF